ALAFEARGAGPLAIDGVVQPTGRANTIVAGPSLSGRAGFVRLPASGHCRHIVASARHFAVKVRRHRDTQCVDLLVGWIFSQQMKPGQAAALVATLATKAVEPANDGSG